MTMRATIVNSKVSKKSATFMLANDGMGYFAYFDVPLGKQANYVKKNSIPGQKVLIEFTETGERRLLLKSIDFIKEAKMTREDAKKWLEGKTGEGKWLYQKENGEFAILERYSDPHWLKEALYLFSDEQIEAAVDWLCEVSTPSEKGEKQ